jgi:hypothetical protein
LRGQKSLGPLKMSLEMAHKVIVPPKKIMSRSFLNSGTLIVIFLLSPLSHLLFFSPSLQLFFSHSVSSPIFPSTLSFSLHITLKKEKGVLKGVGANSKITYD